MQISLFLPCGTTARRRMDLLLTLLSPRDGRAVNCSLWCDMKTNEPNTGVDDRPAPGAVSPFPFFFSLAMSYSGWQGHHF